MLSCDGLKHFVVHTANASVESVLMTPISAHILLERGRVRHRDQRAETLQKFHIQMIGARHPPMIGVLPISCVLALIWAQEEN
jgi:hypothetical protein